MCDELMRCKQAGVPLRQMAILFRLRTFGKAFQSELQKRKIPVLTTAPSEYGSPYRKALAMDMLAYIKLAISDDDKAFCRVLNKPKRGLGDQALEKIRQTQERFKCSLLQAAKKASRKEVKDCLTAAQQKGVSAFLRLIQDLRVEVESKSATEVLKSLVPRVFGNESSSSKSSNKDKDKHDDMFTATALVNTMIEDLAIAEGLDDEIGTALGGSGGSEGDARGEHALSETARKLNKLVTAVSNLDTDGLKKMRESEVVRLSTIHQAKGLEFSHVWIVHLSEGVCPLRPNFEACEDEEQMEQRRNHWLYEERRVAYVAVTRAKHQLYISWVGHVNLYVVVSQ